MDNEIETLIADLTCDEVIKCQNARRKLVSMGSVAVERLARELSNPKYWVRWEAAKALGQIGDKAAAKALVAALEDKIFDVRWLAAEALIHIGKGSLDPLLEALADHGDKSQSLRNGAHHVLHDMDRGDLNGILQPVMVSIGDNNPAFEVLQEAQKALEAIRNRKQVGAAD